MHPDVMQMAGAIESQKRATQMETVMMWHNIRKAAESDKILADMLEEIKVYFLLKYRTTPNE